jgi:hypothetical protein
MIRTTTSKLKSPRESTQFPVCCEVCFNDLTMIVFCRLSIAFMLIFGMLFNLIPWMLCDMILYAFMVHACLQPFLFMAFGPAHEAVAMDVLRALINL